ncbi:uncharacterized protein LOC135153327 [Lytechinus pictus]|uniref:uncharacterized protein LOC135153327 n=1 Tax=Lytechinus pictus TaxID=7653 RepID=UPI0030BA0C7E
MNQLFRFGQRIGKPVSEIQKHIYSKLTSILTKPNVNGTSNNIQTIQTEVMETEETDISSGEEAYYQAAIGKVTNTPSSNRKQGIFQSHLNKTNDRESSTEVESEMEWRKVERKKRKASTRTINEDDKRVRKGSFENKEGSCSNRKKGKEQNIRNEKKSMIVEIRDVGEKSCISKISPARLIKEITSKYGEVSKITKEKGSLKVTCIDETQMKKILEMTELIHTPVKVAQHLPITQIRGVIHKVDTLITEEELNELLKEQGVTYVKRFNKRINGELSPTPSVLLVFKGPNLPHHVSFLYQKYVVDEFVPTVTRCHKCQQFGHIQKNCKGHLRCVRCGEAHTFEMCPNKDHPKCLRCNLNHSAAYQGCTYYKEAKNIQHVSLQNNLTYAQATKIYHQEKREENHSKDRDSSNKNIIKPPKRKKIPDQPNTSEADVEQIPITVKRSTIKTATMSTQTETAEKSVQTDAQEFTSNHRPNEAEESGPVIPASTENARVDFLAFITFIVNNLDKETSHSNRIRLVVDAAKRCLDINEVSPEMIHDRLQ